MKKEKSLKLNFIMNIILTMSQFIFPLVTFPYVSRILLPMGTGKVSFVTSVVSYFSMFAQLGIPTYGIRACASVRNDKEKLSRTAHELLIINMIMSIIVYGFFFLGLAIVPKFASERHLFIIISATILFNTIGMEWLYKALEEYKYITSRSIAFKFIALIAMFLMVHEQSDYIVYGAISIFAAVASNFLNFINAHKLIEMKPIWKYDLKKHFKSIFIFFAVACATTIYTNLDTILLGFIKTDVDVGYYNAAIKIKIILVSIVTSLGTVLLPRASYYVEHGLKEEFNRIAKKAINFVIIFATPLVLYFILFAKEGIYFLSGSAYSGSILPMQIIMPSILLIGFTNIMGLQMLVPLGREKVVLNSVIIGAVVDLTINVFLIPKMGAVGAAIGTLVAEIAVWIVQYLALKEIVGILYKKLPFISISLAIVFGGVASYWVKIMNLGNFITLLISAIIFFGVYFIVLIIAKEAFVFEIGKQILAKLLVKIKK